MEEKTVHIKIMSEQGHDDLFLVPEKAKEELKRLSNENKWIYLDKVFTNIDTVTEEDLENAEDITVTNMLKGGEEGYKTELMIKNIENDDSIYIDLDSETKKISATINEKSLFAILANKEEIVNGLETLLQNVAIEECNKIATAVGVNPLAFVIQDCKFQLIRENVFTKNENTLIIKMSWNENQMIIYINNEQLFSLLSQRKWIITFLQKKLSEFIEKETEAIKEATNVFNL